MNFDTIKKIIEENSAIAKFGNFGNGVSQEWIDKAQSRLKISFPPSYIWWLKNYSGGEINGDEIVSIYELDFDSVVGGDIVYVNELSRRNGFTSENELIIQENDFGETLIMDLTQQTSEGEFLIYNKETGLKFADNFLEFLEKKINGY